ncbi:hypothetical protein [Nocardiopsis dassonvillei]|uniref:hypothetical protein n=1 Tax=Nocardiopsis dassonvillei TaxID=2014 RepID=UPI00019EFE3A|nr:hypothetical protein [Nocardiopsis dassonvillei]NKY77220.1 hypothetical protein [Nocardiopsis dassonvillei]
MHDSDRAHYERQAPHARADACVDVPDDDAWLVCLTAHFWPDGRSGSPARCH